MQLHPVVQLQLSDLDAVSSARKMTKTPRAFPTQALVFCLLIQCVAEHLKTIHGHATAWKEPQTVALKLFTVEIETILCPR